MDGAGASFSAFCHRSASDQVLHDVADDHGGLPLHIAGDVGVGVQGKGRVGVAQDARQRLCVHAAGQGVCCEGMPQGMEGDVGQTRFFQKVFQPPVSRARIDGLAWPVVSSV